MLGLLGSILTHPANRGARFSSLLRAVHWQLAKRLTGQPWDIPYHGLKLRCHPDSHSASRAIYFAGLPDYQEMRFMVDYLRPGDVFIDVGANVGLYTLLALSQVGAGGRVHAFEPNPGIARILRETLEMNSVGNATVHEVGVSDHAGTAAFDLTGDDCTAHIASTEGAEAELTVMLERLDRLLDDVPYAMAKFDVEGYEPLAIRGMSQWTRDHNPPVMLIEMAGYSERYGVSTPAFIDELDGLGYLTAVYDPANRRLHPTRQPWAVPAENVLAIAREREDFVQERLQAAAD